MHTLQIGRTTYALSDPDGETALAHSIGRAFIELQQLEFCIISFLNLLSGGSAEAGQSFDVFASKTFGNLFREMRKHTFLIALVNEIQETKDKRDFFVHKFLFHRYGGPLMTRDDEYEALVREAHNLADLFASSQRRFENFMMDKSSIKMFVGIYHPDSGEVTFREQNKDATTGEA